MDVEEVGSIQKREQGKVGQNGGNDCSLLCGDGFLQFRFRRPFEVCCWWRIAVDARKVWSGENGTAAETSRSQREALVELCKGG